MIAGSDADRSDLDPEVMMSAHESKPLDEPQFGRWLDDNGSVPKHSVADVIARTRRALAVADLTRAQTDEHVYIALFGNPAFEALDVIARSRLKRAAILFHQFRGSGA